jgi:argininosuccinate lyase
MAGLKIVPDSAKSHKLWGGRFSVPTAASLEALNRSIGTDFRLWPHDIRLSKAWAMALWGAGVLTLDESRQLESGLSKVGEQLSEGALPQQSDEDVHTMIDRMLHEQIGDVASKLHTGRSRNDQVSTATRLWTMDSVLDLDKSVRVLQQVMVDHAIALENDLMPAYTHLQRAQPVSGAHWMLSHFWPLERDRGAFPRSLAPLQSSLSDQAQLQDLLIQSRVCCSREVLDSLRCRPTALTPLAIATS